MLLTEYIITFNDKKTDIKNDLDIPNCDVSKGQYWPNHTGTIQSLQSVFQMTRFQEPCH